MVLIKHLARAGRRSDRFEMLLVTADEAWHISRPLVDFGVRQPVGVGDLTSGLLLVDLLHGQSLQAALEHVTAAVYEVMLKTHEMGNMSCSWLPRRTLSPGQRTIFRQRSCKKGR